MCGESYLFGTGCEILRLFSYHIQTKYYNWKKQMSAKNISRLGPLAFGLSVAGLPRFA